MSVIPSNRAQSGLLAMAPPAAKAQGQLAAHTHIGVYQRLVRQHRDIIDLCVSALPDADLAVMGLTLAQSHLTPDTITLAESVDHVCRSRLRKATCPAQTPQEQRLAANAIPWGIRFSRHQRMLHQVHQVHAQSAVDKTYANQVDVAQEYAVWLVAIEQTYDVLPPRGHNRTLGSVWPASVTPDAIAEETADRTRRGEKILTLMAMCPPSWRGTYYSHILTAVGSAFVGQSAEAAQQFTKAHTLGQSMAFGFDRQPQSEAFGKVRQLRGPDQLLSIMRATAFAANDGGLYREFFSLAKGAHTPIRHPIWEDGADLGEAAMRGHMDILQAAMSLRWREQRHDIPAAMSAASRTLMSVNEAQTAPRPESLNTWNNNVSACIKLLDDARMGPPAARKMTFLA
jgi:hypothetical protein